MRRLGAARAGKPRWRLATIPPVRIIRLINQIERNAGSLLVREQINGEWTNVPLIELPTHLAIQHVCRIVRDSLQQEAVRTRGSHE